MMPYVIVLAIWLIGCIATHIWIFRGLVKLGQARGMFDFQVWEDSGTWLIPLFWFVYWSWHVADEIRWRMK